MRKSSLFLTIIIIFMILSLAAVNLYQAKNAKPPVPIGTVHITSVEVGYFGIVKGTNISYKSNLTTNTSFTIQMDMHGNITRVYITTLGFGVTNWTYLSGTLTVYARTPTVAYGGVVAMHVVGKVPFSLIY